MAQPSKEMLAAIRAELAGPAEETLRPVKLLRGATYPEKKPRKTIKALANMKAGRSSFQPAPKPDPDDAFDSLCREQGIAVRADYFTQEEYEDARAATSPGQAVFRG